MLFKTRLISPSSPSTQAHRKKPGPSPAQIRKALRDTGAPEDEATFASAGAFTGAAEVACLILSTVLPR
jgi:hypothetical protein